MLYLIFDFSDGPLVTSSTSRRRGWSIPNDWLECFVFDCFVDGDNLSTSNHRKLCLRMTACQEKPTETSSKVGLTVDS